MVRLLVDSNAVVSLSTACDVAMTDGLSNSLRGAPIFTVAFCHSTRPLSQHAPYASDSGSLAIDWRRVFAG